MTLKEIFGSNLRHYRKARRVTQAQLAEQADLSTEMIGRIERGTTAPSFETIERLTKALEIPEAVLFSPAMLTVPAGERGQLLQKINNQLSRLNESDLARASKLIEALT